jgi:hydrogenase/urease accessory protein HupE
MKHAAWWAWCGWLLCLMPPAVAHEARPLLVSIDEVRPGEYRAELRVPQSVTPDNRPALRWPDECAVLQTVIRCAGVAPGRELFIDWPLFNPAITTMLRFTPHEGATRTVLLGPQVREWQLPEAPGAWAVARQYFTLGVEHILGGIDHLLFVLGLLLIARQPRRILVAITGFTIAHSITLSAAALGMLRVPVPPTEAAIALSIVFLAREALRDRQNSLVWRHPALVSLLFGLLHGLGFASALGDVGLPDGDVAIGLLFFNIGVEAGQIAFIAAVMALALLGLGVLRMREAGAGLQARATEVVAYGIGVPATFWLVERVLVMQP